MKGGIFLDKNNTELFIMFGIVILLAIPIIIFGSYFSKDQEQGQNQDQADTPDVYWGVDSASYTDEDLYQCVDSNFGHPEVWGRYLGDKEGVSTGMDSNEVNYLHDKDIRLLFIYNHLTDATGYDNGVTHANKAIDLAKDLDIPDDVAIFADIEPDYPIDSKFIEGWHDTLADSDYIPAIYGVFNEDSELFNAYNSTDKSIKDKTVLWTAYPQEEITAKENAPEFHPQGPDESLLYGWQYALDAQECNIDTNLFSKEMLDYLW